MELAVRMDATLYFFTTVPAQPNKEKDFLRQVYHAMLAARGDYLQYFYTPTKGIAIAKTKRHIEKGDLSWSLMKFVTKTKFDIVVVDPVASGIKPSTIYDVVENSDGVIVLPEQKEIPDDAFYRDNGEVEKNRTKDFFEVLQQSDLYKLQNNFFRTLGQDKKLFNHLRSLFIKKPQPMIRP